MSDIDDESEIFFSIKFLGRIQVVRPGGMQTLTDAVEALQDPNIEMAEKMKKTKVHLFLTRTAIDILEHKTKFMLYSCALPSVSFCAVHPSQPKILGFIAKHPAADMHHCYIFQSKKFSHLLVSIIGDSFRSYKQNQGLQGDRDLVVEALRHKNKVLERENAELKRRLQANGEIFILQDAGGVQNIYDNESDSDKTSSRSGQVRFFSEDDETPLQRNF
ncbi:PTB domain-containing engulfment adapter protein 1-like isoform X1 [Rhinichthys klamathensis goyatoka]|uniref:PTB domain-containing engulfment adapter protein 1-like isoform X1 n=1 Tax=Rhinichthys klamathensis goyatoka TaxID=3034132 RepID=UPI0024B551C9|nr:PTB domain-containing engulfment adapter protein 1-like isoform X1 [Rhinichthys klamathensis goyatoka]XP_056126678.1 PTB domain-containing engulfment adapter protein 1-like isoform X1 [Rhinichthys klamathensis goyatoka]XP_056126679.1 PTB domain-containing engulfment adapter protein 1-like isoform X1 [Rhinichthys klamathensis goyatoka]